MKPTSILMTPGTGAARRKTVSFGAQVANNDGKRSLAQGQSGLPNNFPGKFPSPWTPKTTEKGNVKHAKPGRGRATKLTATLHSVRESSQSRVESQNEDGANYQEKQTQLQPESDQYWTKEYERYTAKTKQEMRKLLTKQKMAKSFARVKDTEVTELAGKLRDERRKVQKLESKTLELETQMKEYQASLDKAREELKIVNQETAAKAANSKEQVNQQEATELQERQRKISKELHEAREESSTLRVERNNLRRELDEAHGAAVRDRRVRNRTDNKGSSPLVDIWADAVGSTPASAESVKTVIKSSPAKRSHSTTERSPLISFDGDKDQYSTPPKQTSQEKQKDPSPKAVIPIGEQKRDSERYQPSLLDSSLPLPEPPSNLSSPFRDSKDKESPLHMVPSSPYPNDAMSVPIRSFNPINATQPISKAPRKHSVVSKKETKKENVNPISASRSNNKHNSDNTAHPTNDNLQVPALRPSTQIKTSTKENSVPQNTLARLSPGAPNLEGIMGETQRKTSLTTKTGREVSQEKLAEAKKRVEDRKKSREMETSKPVSFR